MHHNLNEIFPIITSKVCAKKLKQSTYFVFRIQLFCCTSSEVEIQTAGTVNTFTRLYSV